MLELYANAGCPFCINVLQKMNEKNLDFIWRSHDFMRGQGSWNFLIGGKTQVPLLVDQQKGLILYESEEILKYLEENY